MFIVADCRLYTVNCTEKDLIVYTCETWKEVTAFLEKNYLIPEDLQFLIIVKPYDNEREQYVHSV